MVNSRLLAETWAGEVRVNLVRAAGLSLLYFWHLIRFYVINDNTISLRFHVLATLLLMGGMAFTGVWQVILSRRLLPRFLPEVSVLVDLFIATVLLGMSKGEPFTQAPIVFLLVIATTAVRGSLRLVWLATLGSLAGYYLALWYWHVNVPGVALQPWSAGLFVPGVLVAGLLAGQAVRQMHRLTHFGESR